MRISVLASSSAGNAIILEMSDHIFLIDAGISCRILTERIKQCGLIPSQISAVFITHEHSDHIKGLETLMRQYRLPVFTHPDTWATISFKDRLEESLMREITDSLVLENVTIDSFPLSHDAAHPLGFSFHSSEGTCSIATDFGIVTPVIENVVRESNVLILESNHDLEMLKNGHYPYFLKKRILSDYGHISNDTAGTLLAEHGFGEKAVFLSHLSQENNRPEIAYQTVRSIIAESGKDPHSINLYPTFPNAISRLIIQNK